MGCTSKLIVAILSFLLLIIVLFNETITAQQLHVTSVVDKYCTDLDFSICILQFNVASIAIASPTPGPYLIRATSPWFGGVNGVQSSSKHATCVLIGTELQLTYIPTLSYTNTTTMGSIVPHPPIVCMFDLFPTYIRPPVLAELERRLTVTTNPTQGINANTTFSLPVALHTTTAPQLIVPTSCADPMDTLDCVGQLVFPSGIPTGSVVETTSTILSHSCAPRFTLVQSNAVNGVFTYQITPHPGHTATTSDQQVTCSVVLSKAELSPYFFITHAPTRTRLYSHFGVVLGGFQDAVQYRSNCGDGETNVCTLVMAWPQTYRPEHLNDVQLVFSATTFTRGFTTHVPCPANIAAEYSVSHPGRHVTCQVFAKQIATTAVRNQPTVGLSGSFVVGKNMAFDPTRIVYNSPFAITSHEDCLDETSSSCTLQFDARYVGTNLQIIFESVPYHGVQYAVCTDDMRYSIDEHAFLIEQNLQAFEGGNVSLYDDENIPHQQCNLTFRLAPLEKTGYTEQDYAALLFKANPPTTMKIYSYIADGYKTHGITWSYTPPNAVYTTLPMEMASNPNCQNPQDQECTFTFTYAPLWTPMSSCPTNATMDTAIITRETPAADPTQPPIITCYNQTSRNTPQKFAIHFPGMDLAWQRWRPLISAENLAEGLAVVAEDFFMPFGGLDWQFFYLKFVTKFDHRDVDAIVTNVAAIPTYFDDVTKPLQFNVTYRLANNWQQTTTPFDHYSLESYQNYSWVSAYNGVTLYREDYTLYPIVNTVNDNIQFFPTVRIVKQDDCEQRSQRYCRAEFLLNTTYFTDNNLLFAGVRVLMSRERSPLEFSNYFTFTEVTGSEADALGDYLRSTGLYNPEEVRTMDLITAAPNLPYYSLYLTKDFGSLDTRLYTLGVVGYYVQTTPTAVPTLIPYDTPHMHDLHFTYDQESVMTFDKCDDPDSEFCYITYTFYNTYFVLHGDDFISTHDLPTEDTLSAIEPLVETDLYDAAVMAAGLDCGRIWSLTNPTTGAVSWYGIKPEIRPPAEGRRYPQVAILFSRPTPAEVAHLGRTAQADYAVQGPCTVKFHKNVGRFKPFSSKPLLRGVFGASHAPWIAAHPNLRWKRLYQQWPSIVYNAFSWSWVNGPCLNPTEYNSFYGRAFTCVAKVTFNPPRSIRTIAGLMRVQLEGQVASTVYPLEQWFTTTAPSLDTTFENSAATGLRFNCRATQSHTSPITGHVVVSRDLTQASPTNSLDMLKFQFSSFTTQRVDCFLHLQYDSAAFQTSARTFGYTPQQQLGLSPGVDIDSMSLATRIHPQVVTDGFAVTAVGRNLTSEVHTVLETNYHMELPSLPYGHFLGLSQMHLVYNIERLMTLSYHIGLRDVLGVEIYTHFNFQYFAGKKLVGADDSKNVVGGVVEFDPRWNNATRQWELPCMWFNPDTEENEEWGTLVEVDQYKLYLNLTVHPSFGSRQLQDGYKYSPGGRECRLTLPFNNMYPTNKGNIEHRVIVRQPVLRSILPTTTTTTPGGAPTTPPLANLVPHKDDHVGWNMPEYITREDELVYLVQLSYPTYINTAGVVSIVENSHESATAGRNTAFYSTYQYVVLIHIVVLIVTLTM